MQKDQGLQLPPNWQDMDPEERGTYMKMKESKFESDLDQVNLKIVQAGDDGNCLFRAIAFQVYGDEGYHELVRAKCMRYIEVERDYFGDFIDGGKEAMSDYIYRKSADGVWGDDLEIQAMTEIYDRSVQIYAYANTPMRTFHEGNPAAQALKANLQPLRLSFHGNNHYNSIVPITWQSGNKLLELQPGFIEDDRIA